MGRSVAATIAIFGSYRIGTLQEEAFAARKLGQYLLKKKLGAGGMGEVYLAEHLLLRRACAVKLIRPDHGHDPASITRFEREVRAMATLTHPNAVEVYDYGHAPDGTFYYVMEYLPGLSLQDLVEKYGPVAPARALHFLQQVCSALQEAHSIGLIHRDIKPSNIIVCERGGIHDTAKLLDFGLVQNVTLKNQSDPRLTTLGVVLGHPFQGEEMAGIPGFSRNQVAPEQVCKPPKTRKSRELRGRTTLEGMVVLGSPAYMSPEQALGRQNVDARADIYALGGVANFLLTGQAPFERESAVEMLLAHVHEPVTPPGQVRAEVPADLEAIVLRCLSKIPKDRYADVEELHEALAQYRSAGEWTRKDAAAWWRDVGQKPTEVAAAV